MTVDRKATIALVIGLLSAGYFAGYTVRKHIEPLVLDPALVRCQSFGILPATKGKP